MDTSTSKLAAKYDNLIDQGLIHIQELDPVGAAAAFEAAIELEPSVLKRISIWAVWHRFRAGMK